MRRSIPDTSAFRVADDVRRRMAEIAPSRSIADIHRSADAERVEVHQNSGDASSSEARKPRGLACLQEPDGDAHKGSDANEVDDAVEAKDNLGGSTGSQHRSHLRMHAAREVQKN